jgi:nitrogen-specific signal transduction histidine kinase/CheY-like chemotaxis protein
MIVNLTDITRIRALQAQYEQAQSMKSIGTLAGGVAHDFNNLLMGIQGRTSLLSVDLPPSHPSAEHIRAIEDYIQSATNLTKQLLGFARGGKYEVTPTDLNELTAASAKMFGRTRKDIEVRTETHTALLVAEVDKRQIEQVLLNLFVNAWQAMPKGGRLYLRTAPVELDETRCKPHQLEPGSYARISITDTGVGMDEETRKRIFDPFFTTKEKTRGTGLGLASAYGIVKNHGGMITVKSDVGRGSTFDLFLPLCDKEIRQEEIPEQKLVRGAETVLLVDDEEMIRDVAASMLEKIGYRVIVSSSGEEAVDVVTGSGESIQIVVLDMIMPGMDGGETFDRIRALQPRIPVLLSSGYTIDGQATEILNRGCNGFIQKPFNLSELSTKIREILDSR